MFSLQTLEKYCGNRYIVLSTSLTYRLFPSKLSLR
jgi:hypothetical protein